jgi:uncharacterized membrane protein YesL
MKKLEHQESPFEDLVLNSYTFFKPLFRRVWWIIIAPFLVLLGLLLLFTSVMFFVGDGFSTEHPPGFLTTLLFCVVWGLIIAYFKAAVLARVYGMMYQDEHFIRFTWKIARARFVSVFGLFCIFGILSALLSIAFLVLAFFAKGGVVGIMSMMVFVVLLAYFWIRFYFALPLLVVYEQDIMEALVTSFEATRGKFWCTAGVLFFVIAVPYLGIAGLQLLFSGAGILLAIVGMIVAMVAFVATEVLKLSATYVLLNDYQVPQQELAEASAVDSATESHDSSDANGTAAG